MSIVEDGVAPDVTQGDNNMDIQKGSIVEEDNNELTMKTRAQSELPAIGATDGLSVEIGQAQDPSMFKNNSAPVHQGRVDRHGNPIIPRAMNLKLLAMENKDSPAKKDKKDDKKNKHKVTFIDKMDKDAELTRIHHVQSYKKYNSMNTYDPYYVEEGEGSSHCCTIF